MNFLLNLRSFRNFRLFDQRNMQILVDKGYECGKSTVHDPIIRFKDFGSPILLKRRRPRESDAGKCTGLLMLNVMMMNFYAHI
jgi:hypothetical protein